MFLAAYASASDLAKAQKVNDSCHRAPAYRIQRDGRLRHRIARCRRRSTRLGPTGQIGLSFEPNC